MGAPALPPSPRACRAAALAVAAPAIIAACILGWWDLRLARPDREPAQSIAFVDALRENRIEPAFERIRAGQDVNAPVVVRDRRLTGGDDVRVRPLLIAVAYGMDDSVKMLMSSGATLEVPGNRLALCLARQLGQTKIAAILVQDGGPTAESSPCPEVSHPGAPLKDYLE